jgi:hypothetical protein
MEATILFVSIYDVKSFKGSVVALTLLSLQTSSTNSDLVSANDVVFIVEE